MAGDPNMSVGKTIPINAFPVGTDQVQAARVLDDAMEAKARALEDQHVQRARKAAASRPAGANMNLNIIKAR
jgi:hypothetical protein